jgi:hypothetical protein
MERLSRAKETELFAEWHCLYPDRYLYLIVSTVETQLGLQLINVYNVLHTFAWPDIIYSVTEIKDEHFVIKNFAS